jgi:hypothetical protein
VQYVARVLTAAISLAIFIYSFYYVAAVMSIDKIYMEGFDTNDDWHTK